MRQITCVVLFFVTATIALNVNLEKWTGRWYTVSYFNDNYCVSTKHILSVLLCLSILCVYTL